MLMEVNRNRVSAERERIDNYVRRRNWRVVETGTGLRYHIYQKSDSSLQRPVAGNMVYVTYSVSLIDGTQCYSRVDHPETFRVEQDNVESGLHEGIQFMRPGEKAHLILPPHLAHGLIGDMDKIPMNATIIYDIHLLRVQ